MVFPMGPLRVTFSCRSMSCPLLLTTSFFSDQLCVKLRLLRVCLFTQENLISADVHLSSLHQTVQCCVRSEALSNNRVVHLPYNIELCLLVC